MSTYLWRTCQLLCSLHQQAWCRNLDITTPAISRFYRKPRAYGLLFVSLCYLWEVSLSPTVSDLQINSPDYRDPKMWVRIIFSVMTNQSNTRSEMTKIELGKQSCDAFIHACWRAPFFSIMCWRAPRHNLVNLSPGNHYKSACLVDAQRVNPHADSLQRVRYCFLRKKRHGLDITKSRNKEL
jgi:hypothetical protein